MKLLFHVTGRRTQRKDVPQLSGVHPLSFIYTAEVTRTPWERKRARVSSRASNPANVGHILSGVSGLLSPNLWQRVLSRPDSLNKPSAARMEVLKRAARWPWRRGAGPTGACFPTAGKLCRKVNMFRILIFNISLSLSNFPYINTIAAARAWNFITNYRLINNSTPSENARNVCPIKIVLVFHLIAEGRPPSFMI